MLRGVPVLLLVVLVCALWFGAWVRAVRAGGSHRRRALLLAVVALALVAGLGLSAPDRQKLLAYLVMPPGLVWLGLVAVGRELFHRRERILGGAVLALFFVYTLMGNVLIGTLGLIALERSVEHVDWTEGPPFDAVLVLGGGTKSNPPPARYALANAGDRVLLGARLYRRGRTRKLVCSGRGVPGISDEDLTEATTAIWTELGIPEEDIVRLRDPFNTKQEIAALAAAIEAHGWRRVGLVTSGAHLPRAMALARAKGLDLAPLAADLHLPPERFTFVDFVPQRAGFSRTSAVMWELVGRAVGR